MRTVFALLALVAVAYAGTFAIDAAGAAACTVNGAASANTAGMVDAVAVLGTSVVHTAVPITDAKPIATYYVWLQSAACVAADGAAALAKNMMTGVASDGASSAPKYNIFLKKSTAAFTAADNVFLCIWDGSALIVSGAAATASGVGGWKVIAASNAAATVVTSVAKIGAGPFVYGDAVKFTSGADITTGAILTLGAAAASSLPADLYKVGGVVAGTTAANVVTADGMAYLGTASGDKAAWAATGVIQTIGIAQTTAAAKIAYLHETSAATLVEVGGKAMPAVNYTFGQNVTFKVMQNNSMQGAFFYVWASKAGTAALCDAAITGDKALLVASGATSTMKWTVPPTEGTYKIWAKSANVTIACTEQAFGALVVKKPLAKPTAAPTTAPVGTPTAAPTAAATTGTSGASAVRGGLVAAFACVLAGLGLTAAF